MSEAANPQPSLSERLIQLAGDDLKSVTDERAYLAELHLIITAWNMSVAPGNPKLTQRFDNAVLHAAPNVRQAAEARVAGLVDRKKALFPDDRRVVLDARLRRHPGGITFETKSAEYNPQA